MDLETDAAPLEDQKPGDLPAPQGSTSQPSENDNNAASPDDQMDAEPPAPQGSTSQPSEKDNNAAPLDDQMDAEPPALQGSTSQNDNTSPVDQMNVAQCAPESSTVQNSEIGISNNAASLHDQMDAEPPAPQGPSVRPAEKDNKLGTKFFVQLEGKTNGAHQRIITKLKDAGHIEVDSREKSEILLVCCPIVTRVGTDVSDALENIPDGKPTILVVMHHTFKHDLVVAESRRLVEKPDVKLTVDCLFYDGKLLDCDCNQKAWIEVQKFLKLTAPQGSTTNANAASLEEAASQMNVDQFAPEASTSQPSKKDKNSSGEQPGKCPSPKGSTSKPSKKDNSSLLGKKFFVQLEGKTNGAHQRIVTKLKDGGHIEVDSREKSDFLLVFCPIVSRVGTDVSEALENIPDDKQTILVVMHHTFKPDHIVAESRRLVEKPNIKLTVDCLFYDGKLLDSKRNEIAWFKIQELFGVLKVKVKSNKSKEESKHNCILQ